MTSAIKCFLRTYIHSCSCYNWFSYTNWCYWGHTLIKPNCHSYGFILKGYLLLQTKYRCYSCQAAVTSELVNRLFGVLGKDCKILCGLITVYNPFNIDHTVYLASIYVNESLTNKLYKHQRITIKMNLKRAIVYIL